MIARAASVIRRTIVAGCIVAVHGEAQAQQTKASASYDFVPTAPLARKYKLVSTQSTLLPSFTFDYQYGSSNGECQATFATAELSVKEGRYEFELWYNFTCPFKTGLSTLYVSRDKGRLVEAPDGLYFLHDPSTDRTEGRNILGTASSSFDHDLRYVAIADVQEEKGKARQFEVLLLQTNAYRGKTGTTAGPMFWMFPSDAKLPVKTAKEARLRDQSGERYWMPQLRAAVGVDAQLRGRPPFDTTKCTRTFVLPDSVWLISGDNRRSPITAWSQSGWTQISAPAGADTIGMSVMGVQCSKDDTAADLLLERYGFYLKVDTASLSKVASDASITPSLVRTRSGPTELAHVLIERMCAGGECTASLKPAEPVAMKLKTEIAKRNAIAERAAQAKRAQARAVEERRATAAEAARRARDVARFKGAGASATEIEAALAGRVTVGMSQVLVTEILGKPTKVDRRTTELGTYIAWHYSGLLLEMANGRVKAIR